MDSRFAYNTITVTTESGRNQVQFDVELTEGTQREVVSLQVSTPMRPTQSLLDLQKEATRRAIEILQGTLSE
jgi:hypothetical protein